MGLGRACVTKNFGTAAHLIRSGNLEKALVYTGQAVFRMTAFVAGSLVGLGLDVAATAGQCTQTSNPIETDRPDTTNSSIVVPVGSLQNENGSNVSRRDGADIFDGTNSRWRLGVAPCFELLIDLPNYIGTFHGTGGSGFSDVTPAMKLQVSPLPGTFDLSITAGMALPTGARVIAGPGVQPYLQFPWSIDLGNGWAITGMETNFFTPSSSMAKYSNQSTIVLEKEVTERSFLFIEYVGDFPVVAGNSQLFNSGGGYRITETQQVDFHLGVGLNRNAPSYIFGVGYSFRLDGLFR
jgi:hypothetical protein